MFENSVPVRGRSGSVEKRPAVRPVPAESAVKGGLTENVSKVFWGTKDKLGRQTIKNNKKKKKIKKKKKKG